MGLMRFVRAQWDRVAGATAMLTGGIAIVAGWIGVSRATVPAAQLPYIISGGIGGLFLLGLGATLWLSADLRDEWRHLDALEDRVVARVVAHLDTQAEAAASNGHRPARTETAR